MTEARVGAPRKSFLDRLPPRALPFAGLFVVSGACGLIYEVVWSRLLVQVFGVTAFAVSTVLVSFMGGMALGAALLGRRADEARRPLRMFAILEAGVGAYALLLPLLLAAVDGIYGRVFPALPDSFLLRSTIRFAFCLFLLLVPAALMGGTLPALGRGLLRRKDQVGLGVGVLYFVNTLGAAVGCFLAGFHLIPAFGLLGTTLLAAAGNAAVATTAWALDRKAPADEEPEPRTPPPAGRAAGARPLCVPESWPLVVAFGSGLAALAFEIVWFRVLVLVFGSTVYSFSAMLSVFLLGLALGSLVLGRLADRFEPPVRLLALTQGGVALFALAGAVAVNAMPGVFLRLISVAGMDFRGMNATKLLLSLATLVPAAFAFGGTFPVAVQLSAARRAGTGSRIGRVYAWNTLGAIVGSFGTGFLLLPAIGAEWTLKLVVALSLLLAFGSLLAEPGPLRLRWAVPSGLATILVAAMLFFAPPWDRRILGAGAYFEPRTFLTEQGEVILERVAADYRLMTYTEGYNETIISFRSPKGKFITVNGSPTASDHFEDMFAQRMLAHLPMALHPGTPREACYVGLGAGVTAGAIALYDIRRLDAIELEEGVFEATRFFAEENHDVLGNPKVAVHIDDGRSFLKLTRKRYDVISSHPNFPSLSGSGALFGRDYLELCRERLAPGGIVCHYAPFWRLRQEEVRTIVATFCDVFPHVRFFSTGMTLVMLGREEPFPPVDLGELTRRASEPAVAASLAGIGVREPLEILSFYQGDETDFAPWLAGSRISSDDRPRVEFDAPRGLFDDTFGRNLAEIARRRPSTPELAGRLGLEGEDARSFVAFSEAYRSGVVDAQILRDSGKSAEAMAVALPAAESGQRYARYLVADWSFKLGLAAQRAGRLAEAREHYALAVRFEPDHLDAMIDLGYVDLFLGRMEEAEAVLERSVSRFPASAAALHRLGILRDSQGRLEEAEELYRKAIEIEPELPGPHALLGNRLLAAGRVEESLDESETAIRLGERTEGVLAARVAALIRLGRFREALGRARDAVEVVPGSTDLLDLLATAAERTGRAEEAAEARHRSGVLRGGAPSPVEGGRTESR